jgi:hypothetical protein
MAAAIPEAIVLIRGSIGMTGVVVEAAVMGDPPHSIKQGCAGLEDVGLTRA